MEYDIEEFQENIEEVKKLCAYARANGMDRTGWASDRRADGPLGAGVLVYDMC